MSLYSTLFEGIRFIEGRPPSASIIKPIRVEIGGMLTSAQLKNLDDVKRLMADRAKEAGGNAVVDFKYGQRSVGFWRSLIDRDDVNWYGEGRIALLK
jgi:hypothetical protein